MINFNVKKSDLDWRMFTCEVVQRLNFKSHNSNCCQMLVEIWNVHEKEWLSLVSVHTGSRTHRCRMWCDAKKSHRTLIVDKCCLHLKDDTHKMNAFVLMTIQTSCMCSSGKLNDKIKANLTVKVENCRLWVPTLGVLLRLAQLLFLPHGLRGKMKNRWGLSVGVINDDNCRNRRTNERTRADKESHASVNQTKLLTWLTGSRTNRPHRWNNLNLTKGVNEQAT